MKNILKALNFNNLLLFSVFIIPFAPRGVGLYFNPYLPILDLPRMFIGLLILAWAAKKIVKRQPLRIYWNLPVKFLLGLISLQLISVFVSSKPLASLVMFLGYLVNYYLVFFIFMDQISDTDGCEKIVNIMVFTTVCLAAISLFESLTGHYLYNGIRMAWQSNPLATFRGDMNRDGLVARIGPYGNNHEFGRFFASAFFLLLGKYFTQKSGINKFLMIIVMIIVFLGALSTEHRTVVIAIIVTLFISVFTIELKTRYRLAYFTLSMVFLSIALTIFIFINSTKASFDFYKTNYVKNAYIAEDPEGGVSGRILSVKTATPYIIYKPLLGYGFGTLNKGQWIPSNLNVKSDLNIYFIFALDSGILAGIAFVLFIFLSLLRSYLLYVGERAETIKWLKFSVFLSIFCYAINQLNASGLESSFYFFILLAMTQFWSVQDGKA